MEVKLTSLEKLNITTCNHNFSKDGILHPDRILTEYDLLYLSEGTWDIWEEESRSRLK